MTDAVNINIEFCSPVFFDKFDDCFYSVCCDVFVRTI